MATEEVTTGDKELELLLRNFHRVSQGYKDALTEVQALRLNCCTESKRCEALESHIADLKRDNERLRRLYTETLFKFTNQVKFHVESQSLKEELEKANCRLLSMEEEHKREIEQLKHSDEVNSRALESKLRYENFFFFEGESILWVVSLDCRKKILWVSLSKLTELSADTISCAPVQQAADDVVSKQLKLELSAHKAHIDMLRSRLEQVTADVHAQYKNEILDLKDVIAIEQEEKKDMHRKLQNAENELRITRMKQAEKQKDLISVQHVETLKQKVMKLRKENESLKRKLASKELGCS